MTRIDLENALVFPINWDLFNKYISTDELILANKRDKQVKMEVEKNVNIWLQMIERVKQN